MSADTSEVEFSLAEEQDFNQVTAMDVAGHVLLEGTSNAVACKVLNICSRDDYSGLDYMAATFHRWLQEPGRLVFIARMKDRVVALESALLVDGGKTVVFQGLRVTSDLRGHGIGGALQKHVNDYIRRHYPEVCTVRRSRGDRPSPQTLSKYTVIAKERCGETSPRFFVVDTQQPVAVNDELSPIIQRWFIQAAQNKQLKAILSLCCEATDLGVFVAELQSRLPHPTSSSFCGPVALNQQQAETLLLTDHVVSNLLPGRTIINDWEPLKPVKANLKVLRRRRLTWIADQEVEPTSVSLCTPPYAVPYRHDALRVNINIFGQSLPSVCAVLLAQLEALLPSLRGYLIFLIFVAPELWPGLRRFCQNNAKVSFFKDYWEAVFLEAEF